MRSRSAHDSYPGQACPCPQAGYFWRIHRPDYCQQTSYRAGFFTLYALTVVTFIIEAAIFGVGLRGADLLFGLINGSASGLHLAKGCCARLASCDRRCCQQAALGLTRDRNCRTKYASWLLSAL